MKKIISALLVSAIAAAPVIPAFAEEDTVSVIVDNQKVVFDQPPIIEEGYTLVPIRAVFEQAGATVEWDQDSQTATLTRGTYTVQITLNDTVLYKNGEAVPLAMPAKMVSDRVLIPVRAIGEAMDFDINWDGFHSQVVVSTDGTEYRPYAARRMAFRKTSDCALYYSDQSFTWQDIDVDGDGSMDTVSFTSTLDTSSEATPLLMINGENFTNQLNFLPSIKSFALVDVNKDDKFREIIITANGDCPTAYFFRYSGTSLVPIMNGENRASVKYAENLFFDEKSYILSDIEGILWTDIMVTGGTYQLLDNTITQYYVSNASKIIPRKLVHTYDDNMLYQVFVTDTFKPGTYKTMQTNDIRKASDFTEFTLNNMHIDELTPERTEFFITLPDGTNMVIVPYSS